jgi:hypothetical protein
LDQSTGHGFGMIVIHVLCLQVQLDWEFGLYYRK